MYVITRFNIWCCLKLLQMTKKWSELHLFVKGSAGVCPFRDLQADLEEIMYLNANFTCVGHIYEAISCCVDPVITKSSMYTIPIGNNWHVYMFPFMPQASMPSAPRLSEADSLSEKSASSCMIIMQLFEAGTWWSRAVNTIIVHNIYNINSHWSHDDNYQSLANNEY